MRGKREGLGFESLGAVDAALKFVTHLPKPDRRDRSSRRTCRYGECPYDDSLFILSIWKLRMRFESSHSLMIDADLATGSLEFDGSLVISLTAKR